MKTAIIAIAFACLGVVSAADRVKPIPNGHFHIQVTSEGFGTERSKVVAHKRALYVDQKMEADCEEGDPDRTYFYAKDGRLYLYSTGSKPQLVYLKPGSDSGLKYITYTVGDEKPPRGSEFTGWHTDDYGNLSFKGNPFTACRHPGTSDKSPRFLMSLMPRGADGKRSEGGDDAASADSSDVQHGVNPQDNCYGVVTYLEMESFPIRCDYK